MASKSNDQTNPMTEFADYSERVAKGAQVLSRIREEDVKIGATPKTEVANFEKVRLFHYDMPDDVKVDTGPVLIVYGLIGRYTMADLQEDRSLVRNLRDRGVDLWLVDWGHPTRADRCLKIDHYVEWYLDDCVEKIREMTGHDKVTILGICEGGVFSAIYASRFPDKVKNLIVTITPFDFHGDMEDEDPTHGVLNLWTRSLTEEDIDNMLEAFGNLPGEIMGSVFQLMTPIRSLTKYNVDLLDAAQDEKRLLNFLRMEKWLADRPNHPGAAARQWLLELYKKNLLIKGEFMVSGRPVDLGAITMPVLNVFAKNDHIIPPPCARALKDHVGTNDYTDLELPGGHVGVYVSSKSQGIVGDGIHSWLIERN
ncbi:alpha/beta fold hydrolase [Fulvimarina sp. MAC3]|uniref:alpha/beta fold hydrolase n=1 Tax=Fulvimarina sp. MAC3 TaxID=3148887 RepID=UPI0031FE4117